MGDAIFTRRFSVDGFEPIAATGGTITEIGDYRYHAFTSVGTSTFNVSNLGTNNGLIDLMLIGGGGGGGSWGAGGGGAGGLVFVPNFQINTPINYPVVVGVGGTGKLGYTTSNQGSNGSNSSVFGLTAIGGGVGGSGRGNNLQLPGNGGSGGGSSHDGQFFNNSTRTGLQPSQSGFSGSPYGFGTTGGFGFNTAGWMSAAGGGGAGEGSNNTAGTPPDSNGITNGIPPRGGNGLFQVVINGTTYNFSLIFPLSNIGQNVNNQLYFAGGGGAGGSGTTENNNARIGGAGGLGGGGGGGQGSGTATSVIHGKAGVATTGGGGGGGGASYDTAQSNARGGNGGSGIVVIRYKIK